MFNTPNYREQGGAKDVIGGEIDITGTLKIGSVAVTPSAAEINKTDGIDTAAGAKLIQVQSAEILFSDSAKALFTIPNGAKIYSATIIVTAGFDGTTPTYDVGYAADADAIIDGVALSSTAGLVGVNAPAATASQWSAGVTSGVLVGTFAGGGSNTAGAGVLRVAYYV